jgi:hypothetical protein
VHLIDSFASFKTAYSYVNYKRMKGLPSCITMEALFNAGTAMLRNLLAILADGNFHSGEELGNRWVSLAQLFGNNSKS